MTPREPNPTTDEIKSQLARMLASKPFKIAANQADFLKLVVERTLAGHQVTGPIIGQELFGPHFKTDQLPDVRVTANSLRKKLDKYYEKEGLEDPIVIRLPTSAYRPTFHYSPHSKTTRQYKLGVHYLNSTFPEFLGRAINIFRDVIAENPDHVGANIGLTEALCLSMFIFRPSSEIIQDIHVAASILTKLAPQSWHAHAAVGAVWFLSANSKRAAKAFGKALQLDTQATLDYGWYRAFLFSTGRRKQALFLARESSEANPQNPMANALYGVYLYMNRQYDVARYMVEDAEMLLEKFWLVHLMLSAIAFSTHHGLSSSSTLQEMDDNLWLPDDHPWLPGLAALYETHRVQGADSARMAMLEAEVWDLEPHKGIQAALFYIATGQPDRAIEELRIAWYLFEPEVLFLDSLPVFDSLRHREDFQEIVRLRFSMRQRGPCGRQMEWDWNNETGLI